MHTDFGDSTCGQNIHDVINYTTEATSRECISAESEKPFYIV